MVSKCNYKLLSKLNYSYQDRSSLAYNTVNREIFVYENIHVLNIRVNKFSRVQHENILSEASDTNQLVALIVAKVTIDTDRWQVCNGNVY